MRPVRHPSRDTREVSGYLRPNTMHTLTVQLPDSLHRSIQALVEREGYSIDQFLASAAAEKMAALTTLDFLRREAAQGRREDFDAFLAAVPHGPVPGRRRGQSVKIARLFRCGNRQDTPSQPTLRLSAIP